MSYWEKLKTNKQIYTYIYIQKLDKTHTLYIDFANPTWADRFPVFYLSFEGCQICNVFYFLRYGIPDFRSEIWYRLFAICFSFNMIDLKFFSWLMSKIIMILDKLYAQYYAPWTKVLGYVSLLPHNIFTIFWSLIEWLSHLSDFYFLLLMSSPVFLKFLFCRCDS